MFYHSTWGTVSRGLLTRRCGLGIAGLVLLTLVLAFSPSSEASRTQPAKTSILTVTSDSDNGPGSLRQAILDAQPGDVINFAPNLAGATIRLTSGQLVVSNTLTIDGSTAPGVTVSGNGASRVVRITDTARARLRRVGDHWRPHCCRRQHRSRRIWRWYLQHRCSDPDPHRRHRQRSRRVAGAATMALDPAGTAGLVALAVLAAASTTKAC